jgi:hypothetical protein
MVGMQSVNAQVGIVALHHAGKATVYGEDKVADAIAAAVEGDTIYLSEGHFIGDITIEKPIHMIGSGQGTIINGDITISIDNNPTLSGYMLVGMRILGDILPEKSLNGLRISQCHFKNYAKNRNSKDIIIKNLYIERSYCTDYFYLNELEDGNVYSCKINYLYSYHATNRSTLNHCNIRYTSTSGNIGFFAINCIDNASPGNQSSFQNCLFINNVNLDSYNDVENCWSTQAEFSDELDCSLSDAELQANGYIGTDNTVVGITGGEAPYTLSLATPKVLQHNIVVDKQAKKLNVTLTVGNE